MQMAIVEYPRNVLGWADANTTEVDPGTTHPVIDLMPDQRGNMNAAGDIRIGGTLRLGGYACDMEPNSLAAKLYGGTFVRERHRHRYEGNNQFVPDFEAKGLHYSGWNPERHLAEIMELPDTSLLYRRAVPPEFRSRPDARTRFRGICTKPSDYARSAHIIAMNN
jgi:CTP synthase